MSPKNAITDLWGEQVAQALHDRRGVVLKCDFPFVYWEGMERVMKSFGSGLQSMSPTFKGQIVSSRLYPSQSRMFARVVAGMMRQLYTSLTVEIQAVHNYSPHQVSGATCSVAGGSTNRQRNNIPVQKVPPGTLHTYTHLTTQESCV